MIKLALILEYVLGGYIQRVHAHDKSLKVLPSRELVFETVKKDGGGLG